jgi:hypothetical protein
MKSFRRLNWQTVELGGLTFKVCYTELPDNGGPTIMVFGEVGGEPTEVLRFDAFRKGPHYHAPTSSPENPLDHVDDPLKWSLTQVRDNLPELIVSAGFPDLAGAVDGAALAQGWDRVKQATDAAIPQP